MSLSDIDSPVFFPLSDLRSATMRQIMFKIFEQLSKTVSFLFQVLIFPNTASPRTHWPVTETDGRSRHQHRDRPCRLVIVMASPLSKVPILRKEVESIIQVLRLLKLQTRTKPQSFEYNRPDRKNATCPLHAKYGKINLSCGIR